MKNKYIIGGVIVTAFLAVMIILLSQSSIGYEADFHKVMEKGKEVKATGTWVKEKPWKYDTKTNVFDFHLKDDQGTTMRVVYNGPMPNNFEHATSVVVTGKYHENYFHARDILTKCPSKYQDNKTATVAG